MPASHAMPCSEVKSSQGSRAVEGAASQLLPRCRYKVWSRTGRKFEKRAQYLENPTVHVPLAGAGPSRLPHVCLHYHMPTSDATGRADPLTSSREWRAASEWSGQVPWGPDPVKICRHGCTVQAESNSQAALATYAVAYKTAGGRR